MNGQIAFHRISWIQTQRSHTGFIWPVLLEIECVREGWKQDCAEGKAELWCSYKRLQPFCEEDGGI